MHRQIIIFALFLFLLSVQNVFSFGKNEKNMTETGIEPDPAVLMSGTLENGLRVIPVNTDSEDLFLLVYRGDYIVIETVDGKSHNLVIPSLDVDKQIPVTENEKPFIKMKETGDMEFAIDGISGVLRVIDFEGPRYWELSSKEGADLIKNINPFILDVRTEGEYLQEHLEGAFLLPVQVLEKEIGLIEKYKDQDILIYCRSGNRSTVASKILLDSGFSNIYNLRSGINGWVSEGYSVVVEKK